MYENNDFVSFDPTLDNAIVRDVEVDNGDLDGGEIKTPHSTNSHESLSNDSRIVGAVVLAVGPDINTCKRGDIVLYVSNEAYEIDDRGTNIVQEEDILAVGANLRNKT